MKRWLLRFSILLLLIVASCGSPDVAQITGPDLTYDEAEQLVSETEVDLNTAAVLAYDFAAEVTEGELSGAALNGELIVQGSDYPASEVSTRIHDI